MKKILLALLFCTGFAATTFAQPVANFSGNPTTICVGKNVTWTNLSTGLTGGTTYTWTFPGASSPVSNSQNPGPRTYTTSGTYSVTLTVSNTNGTDSEIKTNYITVIATPTVSVNPTTGYVGCTVPSTTLTASGANTYTWSPATALNTTTGATVIASPTVTTLYTVTGTNANGCTDQQTVYVSYNTTPPPAPASVTGLTNVCSGQTGVIYTVPGLAPPVPVRNWTVPVGATITAGQGTRSITVTFGSTSGNVCASTTNACGTSSLTCTAVTVNPTPQVGAISTITGPTSACDNQTGVVYTIAPVANASSYTWTVTGGASITTGQGTNTITVTFSTNNSNICVTAGNSCNTTAQVCQAVVVSPNIPTIPGTITGLTTVCSGQAGVTYSVATVPNTTVYTWAVPSGASITAGQGTRSVTVTFGTASGTVCVTAGNGCGTSLANCKTITVDPNPAVGATSTISGPTSVCGNQTGVIYSASVPNASTYSWTITAAGASIISGQGTGTISVTYGTSAGSVCVFGSNSCSASTQTCVAVTVSSVAPAIPGGISGLTTVCNGQAGIFYSIASVPNATVYTWVAPTGATITAGQGTNSVTVSFGSASGNITVTAGNACGTSLPSSLAITVDPNPAVGTVGAITGPSAVCASQTGIIYSIAAVSGASSYTWAVPSGATITVGQGTNTITVTFATSGGNVCVYASNSCSSSLQNCLAVTIDPGAPTIPGGITGLTTVCSGQVGEEYSIAAVANATVYTWTVPAGATITAGQGNDTISVTFGSSSGNITVTAGNSCGTSLASSKAITVDPNPQVGPMGVITGPSAVCANQTNLIYSTTTVSGATTYSWTVPTGAAITAGQGTATVTVTFGTNAGNVCVDAKNSCSSNAAICTAVTIASTAPTIPGGITGLTTVCSGQAGVIYTTGSVATASVYTWTMPTGGSVTAGQGTNSVTVTFGTTSGNICVTAGNACGTSLPSCQAITVDPNPAVGTIGTITGSTSACANQTNVTYIIPAVANASTYTWTVPSSASVTAGQGTRTITVTFGNVSGNICVIAANSCGTSAQSCIAITVSPNAPGIPTGITGATTVCSGQAGGAYSTSPVTNALTYSWTVPTGATITSGQGTTDITVTFGTTSGNICVAAANGCGTSLPSCQAITVSSAVLTVTATPTLATCSSCCDGSATATHSGGSGSYTYAWSPSGGVSATATGLCVGSYTVCVTDAGGCVTCSVANVGFVTGINSPLTDNGTIKVFPNPANDHIYIEGTLSISANLEVSVINMFGQKLINELVHADGTFLEKIDIQGIPSGVYFIEVRSGEMVRNSKIIKIQ